MANKIIVAGIGPGNPAYMVPEALRVIQEAKILVGGKRALAQFANQAGDDEQLQYPIGGDIPAVMAFIAKWLPVHDVVVMVSGDPGYYSLLDALRREFPLDKLQVIPGISSVQLAFSRLALPWHDAELLSFHGRVPAESRLVYEPGRILGMLTDGTCNSQVIPQILMKNGWPGSTELAICARLSYEDEVIIRTTLDKAGEHPVFTHCILVVKD